MSKPLVEYIVLCDQNTEINVKHTIQIVSSTFINFDLNPPGADETYEVYPSPQGMFVDDERFDFPAGMLFYWNHPRYVSKAPVGQVAYLQTVDGERYSVEEYITKYRKE